MISSFNKKKLNNLIHFYLSFLLNSMKSTGRTDTMNRSAAFWGNESDLEDESDMSVPMGTGKVEEEKDDFDFYD